MAQGREDKVSGLVTEQETRRIAEESIAWGKTQHKVRYRWYHCSRKDLTHNIEQQKAATTQD